MFKFKKPEDAVNGTKRKFRSIPPRTLFYMAWKNLSSKKLRTGLTLLGMIIGVGAIFFLISLGLGLRSIVTKEVVGSQSVQVIEVLTPNSRILKLNRELAEKVKNLPNVQVESVSYSFPGALGLNGSEIDGIVYGVDSAYAGLSSLNVVTGRLLSASDNRVALVNKAALRKMGLSNDSAALGKFLQVTVPLKSYGANTDSYTDTLEIVGIVDSTNEGSEVFVPKLPFEAAGINNYSQIRVLAKSKGYVPELRKQLESLGLQTSSPLDTIDQINRIFRYFNLVLIGLGAIGMLVAILGMINTLTVALLERTKEIGLMVALGGRNRDMRRLFVYEALLLSMIGALLGVLFASVIGLIINSLMNSFAKDRGVTETFVLFSTPIWLILIVFIFMIVIGYLVSYFPAKRAAKINPIEALRRE